MKNRHHITLATLATVAALSLSACGGSSEAENSATNEGADPDNPVTVTVGTGELSPVNDALIEVAAEKGIDIEWQTFSDWTLPNQALANEETDANAFQHLAFLSAFNTETNNDITPVGSTTITTWGLYSEQHESLDDIPNGATIAIPNDPSNGARALFLLEAAGLIELSEDVGVYPTTDDISDNARDISFNPVVAQQLVNVLPDVDGVVVGAVTIDRALNIPQDEALLTDDPNAETSRPYVNVVAVRGEDAETEIYRELAASWQDPRVAEALEEESKGNTVVVDVPVEELRETLTELEELADELE